MSDWTKTNLREVEDQAPGFARAFEAGEEDLELLAFGPRHQGDGEIIRNGFWGDR